MQSTKAFVCEIFRGQSGGLSLKWGRGRGVPQILPNFLGKKILPRWGCTYLAKKLPNRYVCIFPNLSFILRRILFYFFSYEIISKPIDVFQQIRHQEHCCDEKLVSHDVAFLRKHGRSCTFILKRTLYTIRGCS